MLTPIHDLDRASELETALSFYVFHQGMACRLRRWTANDEKICSIIAADRSLMMQF